MAISIETFEIKREVTMIRSHEQVHGSHPKTSLHRPFHRGIAAMLVLVLGLQSSGCSTIEEQAEVRPKEGVAIRITAVSPGSNSTFVVSAQVQEYVMLLATPTWSSGEGEPENLTFRAEKSRNYLVFAHEEGRGFVPVSVRESDAPGGGGGGFDALGAGMNGPGAGAVILIALLIYGASRLLERKYAAKPSPGCCFVWLEDAETGELLAGMSPWE
jgi:hypothetical protein